MKVFRVLSQNSTYMYLFATEKVLLDYVQMKQPYYSTQTYFYDRRRGRKIAQSKVWTMLELLIRELLHFARNESLTNSLNWRDGVPEKDVQVMSNSFLSHRFLQ